MSLRINQNIAAITAYRNLSVTDGQMSKSLEELLAQLNAELSVAAENRSASESRIRATAHATRKAAAESDQGWSRSAS